MTVALTAFLTKFSNLIGDNLTGTTTSAGNAGGTTFVDSGLVKYEDNYFGDPERNSEWWAYVSSQLRSIKSFTSSSGTVTVHKAFSAQIATSTAYEIHRFDRDKKIVAINEALNQCYPYFYKRVEDLTTLNGKGSSDNQYTVPATFTEFPAQIWQRDISTLDYTFYPVTDYTVQEAAGVFYFYANITLDDDILLIGKTPLTAFTTDASTTELTARQADIIAPLAVSIFYRNLSGVVNATQSERFDSLANRYEMMWDSKKEANAMPVLYSPHINYAWINEQ